MSELDPKLAAAAQALSDEDQQAVEEEINGIDEDVSETEEESESEDEGSEDVSNETQDEVDPEVVQKAKKNGHLNREDYIKKYGSDKGYKSPQEFNKFGDIYPEIKDALKTMNQKLAAREKDLEVTTNYIKSVREREREQARRDVLAALKEAEQMGDVQAVRHLTKEEAKLDYMDAQEVAKKATDDIHHAVSSFEQRNADWYNKDMEMTARATQIDQEIRQGRYAHIMPVPTNYEQLANQIEVIVKNEFANRVQSKQNIRQAPALNQAKSAISKPTGNVEVKFKGLSNDHKLLFATLNRMQGCAYTKEEFINKLKKDGEI